MDKVYRTYNCFKRTNKPNLSDDKKLICNTEKLD